MVALYHVKHNRAAIKSLLINMACREVVAITRSHPSASITDLFLPVIPTDRINEISSSLQGSPRVLRLDQL